MFASGILLGLAAASLAITLWQWRVARRFPLHQRQADASYAPAVTLLKPLKGCDAETRACLRSWLVQTYAGPVQVLFGVASADDPVCEVVRALIRANPQCDARLVICDGTTSPTPDGPENLAPATSSGTGPEACGGRMARAPLAQRLPGPNAKVATLIHLARQARHDVLVVSDADVRAPADLLANLVAPLREPGVGLVCSLYRLANPTTLAMQWEAIAINADFWSQVLQARSLKPLDFALGAVMATRRANLEQIGGFEALVDYLADDYQLGNKIARTGQRIALSPVVVECWDPPQTWRQVWAHQLRWARTIRFCQPLPYLGSLLSNATLWPLLLWLFGSLGYFSIGFPWSPAFGWVGSARVDQVPWTLPVCGLCLAVRILTALRLQARLTESTAHYRYWWLVPVKDLLHGAVWACSFLGRRVSWRGEWFRVRRGGKLAKASPWRWRAGFRAPEGAMSARQRSTQAHPRG